MENSQFSVRADDQKHLVFVEGNINSGNAQEFKEKLSAFESRIRDEAYPIDISGLKYITSAGLRVFLQISRKETLCLLNAPRDVYDIFHITGFDRIFNIRKKPEEIHVTLSDLEIIGEGANGKIYQLDEDTVIKVFQETAPLEEIEQERSLAREALVAGIPTAISYSVVSVDGRYGILFEMVHAESLSKVLKSSPSRYDELTDRYVSLFRKIHETEADKRSFPSIKAIYRKAITDCASWYSGEELEKLRAVVDSIPERNTMIHGDYHPNNLMLGGDGLIIIDMGNVSYGHPAFDFLATAATQVNLVKLNPDYAAVHTRMPAELITKTWNCLIEKYFSGYDKAKRERIEDQIVLLSKLKVALAPHFARGISRELIQASIDDARTNFLPRADELIGAIDW